MESRSILFFCHSIVRRGSLTPASRVSLRGLVCLQWLEATVMDGEGLLDMPVTTRPAYSSLPSSSWKPNKREPRKRPGPFRVRPADEAFEAVSIGGAAEGLAVAALMIAEFDPVGRFRKEERPGGSFAR